MGALYNIFYTIEILAGGGGPLPLPSCYAYANDWNNTSDSKLICSTPFCSFESNLLKDICSLLSIKYHAYIFSKSLENHVILNAFETSGFFEHQNTR